jgi:predicted esterase
VKLGESEAMKIRFMVNVLVLFLGTVYSLAASHTKIAVHSDSVIQVSPKSAVKDLPCKGEVFTIEGRTAFLILPDKSTSNSTMPWVWYAPTLPKLPGKEEKWMFDRFLDAGIAIAGIDVGESYGSPEGVAIYSAFYKDLVKNKGFSKKACLLARSRGGLMLYNWAVENAGSVACIAGIYPVCNLKSYPGLAKACQAYGLTEENLAIDLVHYNPIDRLEPLANAKIPVLHIHGDRDELVPLEENSGLLAKRYALLGGNMTLKIIKGQGHNMWSGWFQNQDLVNFVIRHAGQKSPIKSETEGRP